MLHVVVAKYEEGDDVEQRQCLFLGVESLDIRQQESGLDGIEKNSSIVTHHFSMYFVC